MPVDGKMRVATASPVAAGARARTGQAGSIGWLRGNRISGREFYLELFRRVHRQSAFRRRPPFIPAIGCAWHRCPATAHSTPREFVMGISRQVPAHGRFLAAQPIAPAADAGDEEPGMPSDPPCSPHSTDANGRLKVNVSMAAGASQTKTLPGRKRRSVPSRENHPIALGSPPRSPGPMPRPLSRDGGTDFLLPTSRHLAQPARDRWEPHPLQPQPACAPVAQEEYVRGQRRLPVRKSSPEIG